jgi:hypothetical protein
VYVTYIQFLTFHCHSVCPEFSLVDSYKTISRFVCGFEMRCFVWIRNWAEFLGLTAHCLLGPKNYVSKLYSSQNTFWCTAQVTASVTGRPSTCRCSQNFEPSENELLWSVKNPGHWALRRPWKTSASRAAGFYSVGLGRLLLGWNPFVERFL